MAQPFGGDRALLFVTAWIPTFRRGNAVRNRDELDFSEFMRARWSTLYRTAYLLAGSRHEAEDLLQEALAKTCVRWRGIRDKQAADAYVRRIMVHDAGRRWRRNRREPATGDVPDPGHDGGFGGRDDHLDLWSQIRTLPPRMRAVLVLRYYEDLSEADTARELGCSVGAVKSQAHHAIKRLRSALGDPAAAVLGRDL
jgi:RNA polymerase sigma-70 factor (sigma-E family)